MPYAWSSSISSGKDGSAAAPKERDVTRPPLVQQVLHVLEILHVAALVRGHRNGLGVFLDGTVVTTSSYDSGRARV